MIVIMRTPSLHISAASSESARPGGMDSAGITVLGVTPAGPSHWQSDHDAFESDVKVILEVSDA